MVVVFCWVGVLVDLPQTSENDLRSARAMPGRQKS